MDMNAQIVIKKKRGIFLLLFFLCILVLVFVFFIQDIGFDEPSSPYIRKLKNSSLLAGNYLTRICSDGIFAYEYNALTNSIDTNKYNLLRHAGTIYSMMQLYDVTEEQDLRDDAKDAIDFLLGYKKEYDNISCIVSADRIKLGGTALTIIALVEYTKATNDDQYVSIAQDLAEYIEFSQLQTGEFISKRSYPSGEISDFVSNYYPGETLLALCRLYSVDGNKRWLDIAEKGAQYLIVVRDGNRSIDQLIHDHWLLMALNELYRYRPNSMYLNHSLRIAEAIMHKQKTKQDGYDNDTIGSFTSVRSTPTATRSEGLIAAYHLSKDYCNKTVSEQILQSIRLAVDFQLQMQFTKENVVDLPNPSIALGGFRDSFDSYVIRIDYVQHNLCSILGLYHMLKNASS